jgi:hypothetical protein
MKEVTNPNRRRRLAMLIRRQNGLCALCGSPLLIQAANFDHKIPRSKGGKGPLNYQATHIECNSFKGDRDVSTLTPWRVNRLKETCDIVKELLAAGPLTLAEIWHRIQPTIQIERIREATRALKASGIIRFEIVPEHRFNDLLWKWSLKPEKTP